MTKSVGALLSGLCGFCLSSGVAFAADGAAAAQRYCEDIKEGQQAAQQEYIKVYTPEVNPTVTFQNSISPCMDQISSYVGAISIPGLGSIQGLIDKMSKELMEQGCKAAQSEFDSAVRRAQDSVRQKANEKTGGKYGQVIGTVGSQATSVVNDTVGNAASGVINVLK
ncbi:hypothetical protein [Pseudomonas sp. WS 5532]|uniref:hypothetical protein n=1 Tax=Pseudomonas sp. WS 5532 TaxID=2717495 RepID=UPI0021CC7291|nr:hypothetical protein [Pseudomonas sp. WS 5532]